MDEAASPVLGERFEQALVLAARWHRHQLRKGTSIPYITHLLAVASLVGEHGGTEDEVIAGLLHDAIEDQGGASTRELIRERFGAHVCAIVDGCTDAEVLPKPPWRERKEAHLAQLTTASPSVWLVAAADKLHNIRCLIADLHANGNAVWSRFNGGKAGTLWYYRTLLELAEGRLRQRRLYDEWRRAMKTLLALASDDSCLSHIDSPSTL